MIPKSSVVSTSPVPNSSYHIRFTVTRAVNGFSGLTVHLASASRSWRYIVGQRRKIMRRVGLHALRASRIVAARQHMLHRRLKAFPTRPA